MTAIFFCHAFLFWIGTIYVFKLAWHGNNSYIGSIFLKAEIVEKNLPISLCIQTWWLYFYMSKTAIAFQKHGCHGKCNLTHLKPKFHKHLHLMCGFSLSHTNICGFMFGCMEIDQYICIALLLVTPMLWTDKHCTFIAVPDPGNFYFYCLLSPFIRFKMFVVVTSTNC